MTKAGAGNPGRTSCGEMTVDRDANRHRWLIWMQNSQPWFYCVFSVRIAMLQHIHMLGVHIATDDFGTGYSSLSYLRSFPFDKIKIDQSFVKDADDVASSVAIIRAVTSLGYSLGMQTTAEGVETVEQLERVRREGCTEAQGFLLSRPLPARDIPAMLERTRAVVAGEIIETAPETTGEGNREQLSAGRRRRNASVPT